jgi:hypothetical protein
MEMMIANRLRSTNNGGISPAEIWRQTIQDVSNDEVLRSIQRDIDLAEARLRHNQ